METPDATLGPDAPLTLRGVEREYRVSRRLLSALVRSGELPAIKRGRATLVRRSDLDAFWRREALRRLRATAALEHPLQREASP